MHVYGYQLLSSYKYSFSYIIILILETKLYIKYEKFRISYPKITLWQISGSIFQGNQKCQV